MRLSRTRGDKLARELLPGIKMAVPVLETGAYFCTRGRTLFEEKSHAFLDAAIFNTACPEVIHGAIAGAGFASDNAPVIAREIIAVQGLQEGFKTDEADVGRTFPEDVEPRKAFTILDTRAHPDIVRPWSWPGGGIFRALGEDLVGVLRRRCHHRKYLGAVVVGDEWVKQITHRVDKYTVWLLQLVGITKFVWLEEYVCGGIGGRPGERGKPFLETETLGIAIAAALADTRAPVYRVPGDVGPRNRGCVHIILL